MNGYVTQRWRSILTATALGATGILVLTHQLGRLVPVLSPGEKAADTLRNGASALANPLYAPYHLLQWLAHSLHLDPRLAARLPSVIVALVAVALFTYITRRWYGTRTMLFGVVLMVCSAWLLHTGRAAGSDVVYFATVLAVLSLHILLQDKPSHWIAWVVWGAGSILILTVPGSLWLVAASAALQWRSIAVAWQARSITGRALSAVIGVTELAVLLWWLAAEHELAAWLGIPPNRGAMFQNVTQSIHDITRIGPSDPTRWLRGEPVFDLFLLTMFVVGVVFYALHWRAARTRLVGSLLLVCLVLSGWNAGYFSALVSMCYVVIVGGIAFALHQWLRVFPHNTVARAFGVSLMSILVGLSCIYGLYGYFVAWPQATATKMAYHLTK